MKPTKLYKIQPTKAQIRIMKKAWKQFKQIESQFYGAMGRLERQLSKETKIPDLEFFSSDGDWCGIGQMDREMRLITREELE